MGNDQEKEIKENQMKNNYNSQRYKEPVLHYSDNEIIEEEIGKKIDNNEKFYLNDKKDELNRAKSVNQIKRKKKYNENDFNSDFNSDDEYYEYKGRKKKIRKNHNKNENKSERIKDINNKMGNQRDNHIKRKSGNLNEKNIKILNVNQICSNDDFIKDDLNLEQIDIHNEIIKRNKKFSLSNLSDFEKKEFQNINDINYKNNEGNKKTNLMDDKISDDILNIYQTMNNNIQKYQVNKNNVNNNQPFENKDNNQNKDNINKMNNINNNNIYNNNNNNNIIIPKNIYENFDKRDLKTVIVCMQKCKEKYEEAVALLKKALYIQSLDILIKTRNSYLKLKNAIQQRQDSYPKEFQLIIFTKISEKVSKINLIISQISPLVTSQKEKYNNFKGRKFSNNIPTNNIIKNPDLNYDKFNILTNPPGNLNINNKNNNNYKNIQTNTNNNNIINKKNQNIENQKKKKNIHEKEEDEMDNKILSEITVSNPGVKFSDIIGMKELKQMINEIIIIPTIRPDLFKGILKPQRGILLFGPPGTGKTMIAKAIASECSSTFFNISASSLTSKYIGESEKTVRSLFKIAYEKSPSIIFIDEIDSILSKRSENDNDASKRLKTEFLIQFDGLGSKSDSQLLVIAATNRPMDLDDALLRRLPKRVYCHPLDENGRFDFIKKLINLVDHNLNDNEIKYIAKKTHGYSNGDLQELCREAAYEPVRELKGYEILNIKKFRDVNFEDMKKALLKIRGSLSLKIVKEMEDWNNQFGGI
jgi:spastin